MDETLKFKKKSSQIHEGTVYDPDTGRVSAVLNGAVVAYHSVHPDLIDAWQKADSPGEFFHQYIKKDSATGRARQYSRIR